MTRKYVLCEGSFKIIFIAFSLVLFSILLLFILTTEA